MLALREKRRDPLTQQPLQPSELFDNFALKEAVAQYREEFGF